MGDYGLTTVKEYPVTTVASACDAADNLGYPVVLKAVSRHLVHKSDVGAVKLGLNDRDELQAAWLSIHRTIANLEGCLVATMEQGEAELILGLTNDPEFGPMVLFGFGGVMAELIDDVKLVPAPVGEQRVKTLLSELALAPILTGVRGRPPLDIELVATMISRLSWLAVDAKDWLSELDLNPVLINPTGAVVVDARARVVNRAP